jgi:hypothetical protein
MFSLFWHQLTWAYLGRKSDAMLLTSPDTSGIAVSNLEVETTYLETLAWKQRPGKLGAA